MKHHKEMSPALNLQSIFDQWLQERYPEVSYPPIPPVCIVDPVFGLETPQPNFQVCSVCHRAFKGNASGVQQSHGFLYHKCSLEAPNPAGRTHALCSAQRFENNTKSSWFSVHVHQAQQPSSPPQSPWESYRSRISMRVPPKDTVSLPEEYRVLHQFLQKERWIDHVVGKDIHVLVELVKIGVKDPQLPYLHRHVHAYLAYEQSMVTGHYMRRLLGTRPSCVSQQSPGRQKLMKITSFH
jgi:hypothetical protein